MDDANEDTINKRLETFYSETMPVIEAFESE
jgi:adenylate kinase family enzyme